MKTIAVFYADVDQLDFDCESCSSVKWQGGYVPVAQRSVRTMLITVPKKAFYAVLTVGSLGIAASMAFLCFNLHFRQRKSLKLSSPYLNNMAAVGCILVYVTVICLGVDNGILQQEEYLSYLCTVSNKILLSTHDSTVFNNNLFFLVASVLTFRWIFSGLRIHVRQDVQSAQNLHLQHRKLSARQNFTGQTVNSTHTGAFID